MERMVRDLQIPRFCEDFFVGLFLKSPVAWTGLKKQREEEE